jgi:hypothetical protein
MLRFPSAIMAIGEGQNTVALSPEAGGCHERVISKINQLEFVQSCFSLS